MSLSTINGKALIILFFFTTAAMPHGLDRVACDGLLFFHRPEKSAGSWIVLRVQNRTRGAKKNAWEGALPVDCGGEYRCPFGLLALARSPPGHA